HAREGLLGTPGIPPHEVCDTSPQAATADSFGYGGLAGFPPDTAEKQRHEGKRGQGVMGNARPTHRQDAVDDAHAGYQEPIHISPALFVIEPLEAPRKPN